ncbi:MAG: hypothetical protein DIU80_001600 [Chloroflexota bacterium]|nr:MAG: hypothetical protein DIU80_09095 [Chloroflexota bacterium]
MSTAELDTIIHKLLPQVLSDPDLGDGRVFTRLHLNHLWALSCLHAGECYDEELLADRVMKLLPPDVLLAQEVSTP